MHVKTHTSRHTATGLRSSEAQGFFSRARALERLAGGLLSLALLLLLCGGAVQAQTDSSAAGGTETRARRAAPEKDAKKGDDNSSIMTDVSVNQESLEPGEEAPRTPPSADVAAAAAKTTDETRPDRLSLLRGQIKEARTESERVRLQRTLVDYLVALNRKSEAVAELRLMLEADRLDAASYYNIGNGLARLGDAERAVEAYRKAIDLRQDNYPRALNNLGVVLLSLGRQDEAYDAFVAAIKQQNFRYAEASYNLGKLYAQRDEADLAISEWTRALTVQPDHVDAAVALARAYAVTGKTERGLEVIEATLKRTGGRDDRLEAARDEIAAMK